MKPKYYYSDPCNIICSQSHTLRHHQLVSKFQILNVAPEIPNSVLMSVLLLNLFYRLNCYAFETYNHVFHAVPLCILYL